MIFLLAILLGLQVETKDLGKIETKEDNGGIQFSIHLLRSDSSNDRVAIIPGDSNWQIAENEARARRDRERLSKTNQTISYTGQGTAKKIEKDEVYKNCVEYAKAKTGINRTIGYGGRSGINAYEPRVGAIGAENGKVPHAVVVMSVEGENITVWESNYLVDKDGTHWITERTLKRADFLGFII